MDNLPKDPPDPSENTAPQVPNAPNSPDIPNHPDSVHSSVAKSRKRDAHGRFTPSERLTPPSPQQPTPTPPSTPNPSLPSNPPPIQVTQGNGGGSDKDEPLVQGGFKITNPFSAFFNWIKKLIKNEGINIKIKPLTAIGIALAISGSSGIVGGIIGYVSPHSSPILHRAVIYQGNLQKTPTGFILTLPNSDLYTLKPKANSMINFNTIQPGPSLVKGNLTPESFVIEVSEVIPIGANVQP